MSILVSSDITYYSVYQDHNSNSVYQDHNSNSVYQVSLFG